MSLHPFSAISRCMALAFTATVAISAPAGIAGQEGCEFGEDGNDVLRQVSMTGGDAIFYVTRPHLVCDDGIQIWADSAVAFTSSDMAHLMGSVRFEDPARILRAEEARYFSNVGRLQAEGALYIEDRDEGSIVENGALVYLRETSFRDEETMTVTIGTDGVRPRATIRESRAPERGSEGPDSSGIMTDSIAGPDSTSAADPKTPPARVYVVEGDQIHTRGSTYLQSVGSVEVEVDSIRAFADTLEFREDEDVADLRGSARVVTDRYELRGARVQLTPDGPDRRRVLATRNAELSGDDLQLTAERIFLLIADNAPERILALPPDSSDTDAPNNTASRPRAFAEDFEITADSLDIDVAGEALERIFAAGRARSVSTERDSVNAANLPEIARSDWLEGDTVIVTFRPEAPDSVVTPIVAEGAEAARPSRIERIDASVGARSLYRLAPSGPTARAGVDPPAVHYVVGRHITILMGRDGEVDRLEVDGQTTGVHLEPRPRGTGPRAPDGGGR